MPKIRPFIAGSLAFGAAAALIAGCGSPSPQENVSQACTASEAFGAALKTFQDTLTTDATVEEIQAAREGVRGTYATLVNEVGDVARDRMAEVETATNELNAAVDAVPSDAALSDALGSLKNEATDVVNARNDLDNALKC
ncbi:hypothetical protein GCM10023081_27380 [Arthrobacter ginkgonis]|uniref:Lipoprotein n=1 Tax=Arthrobacter ginkgonis TaxID=1630594 RepID=A0ABP7CE01_9MICC